MNKKQKNLTFGLGLWLLTSLACSLFTPLLPGTPTPFDTPTAIPAPTDTPIPRLPMRLPPNPSTFH